MQISEFVVTGTHIWYYYICKRQVWLISHQITADQENTNIQIGKLIDQDFYRRQKKSLFVDRNLIDVFCEQDGRLVIGEIKKSSKTAESARMQLAYYLLRLKENGVNASGELRFPTERKKMKVELTPQIIQQLNVVVEEIKTLAAQPLPPPAERISFCKSCAYIEFCWS